MSSAMNMPPEVESRIRALPGNRTCADCSNLNPQWASVTYGSLVCLECSGQHRSLGVHLSFVRSVQMDSWTQKQMSAMEQSGGNASLVKYFKSRGIEQSWPIAKKYGTKQAAYYRDRLARLVEGKTEPPPDPGNYDPVSGGDAQGAEPLPGETTEQYNARQARLRDAARERMRAKFGDQGLGSVGSPEPAGDDGLMGGLGEAAGGAARVVGGAVGGLMSGVGSFLKNNVIENTELHSGVKGVVGGVGETASGAWSSLRQTVAQGEVIDALRKNATFQEDTALRNSASWTFGAVGGLLEKATEGVGQMGSVFQEDEGGNAASAPAPRCSKGHKLRTDPRSEAKCNICRARGTRYACCETCDYNICTKCFERPAIKTGPSFDDDDWGETAPPEPTEEELQRLAQSMGMTLNEAGPSSASGTKARPAAPTPSPEPAAAAPQPASNPSPKPKAAPKEKLKEPDDFFAEFGV